MFEPDFMAKEKGLEEECRTWVVSDELHGATGTFTRLEDESESKSSSNYSLAG